LFRRGLLSLLMIACLALASCGGDSDSSSEESASGEGSSAAATVSGPTLKKAAYVKKGDAICRQVPQNSQPLFEEVQAEQKKKKGKQSETAAKEELTLRAAIPPIEEAVEEFSKVGAPKGEEEVATEILHALEAAEEGLKEDPAKPLFGPKSPFAEFSSLTKKHGFAVCPQL
jgi:hypothetical protein